jgi:hypothetical protein
LKKKRPAPKAAVELSLWEYIFARNYLPPLQQPQPAARVQFGPGAFPKFSHLRNNDAFEHEHERQTPNEERQTRSAL